LLRAGGQIHKNADLDEGASDGKHEGEHGACDHGVNGASECSKLCNHTVDSFVKNAVKHEAKSNSSENKPDDGENIKYSRNGTPKRKSPNDDGQQRHGERENEGGKEPSKPEQLGMKPHYEHHLFDFDL
jgi:hypothetical protein